MSIMELINTEKVVDAKQFVSDFRQKILPLLPEQRWNIFTQIKTEIKAKINHPESARAFVEWSQCLRALEDYFIFGGYQGDAEMHQATIQHQQ